MDEKFLKLLRNFRKFKKNNINSEIFLDSKKSWQTINLANKRQLDVAVICGENEFKDNKKSH